MKIVAFFVRHGDTDYNDQNSSSQRQERYRGDIDVPLNDLGQKQAADLVPYFGARQFSAAFTSGMKRTKDTLAPLLEDKGMKSTAIVDFNGLDTGDFSGQPKSKKNKKKLDYYRENPEQVIPGGESVAAFRNRVDPKIMTAIHIGEESGKPTISCVHGSVMRELSRLLHDDYNKVKVDPGGVVGIFKSANGFEAKALLNESETEEDIRAGS